MAATIVGLIHPGEMGVTIGASVLENVSAVLWASRGRSARTVRRAQEAGLQDAGSLEDLVRRSDTVLSVVPPHAAIDVASEVAALGFRGIYADLNAVSPDHAREIGRIVERNGASFVDGGIVGQPAWRPGTTRVYLSGPDSETVAACFRQGRVQAIVFSERPIGAASAFKMAYAAHSKGSAALLAAVMALATREGVLDALLDQWATSHNNLGDAAMKSLRTNAPKAWRFVGEMEEIARTFTAAGLPPGFLEAAGELYRRLESHADEENVPSAEVLIQEILAGGPVPAAS